MFVTSDRQSIYRTGTEGSQYYCSASISIPDTATTVDCDMEFDDSIDESTSTDINILSKLSW